MKIGFIGLGIMGRPMAKNLLRAGHALTVCDHHPEHVAELAAAGARAADTPREAAAGKPRRYYHLTQPGRAALREKETSWNRYARAVNLVLGGGPCCVEG